MLIEEYIHQHNQLGQLVDLILHFHQQGGARIKGIIPKYRKEDVENLGNGVLIEYDIYNGQLQTFGFTSVACKYDCAMSNSKNSDQNEQNVGKAPLFSIHLTLKIKS